MAINRKTRDELGADVQSSLSSAPAKLGKGTVLRGANQYHRSTVLRQRIDFGGLTGLMTGQCGAEFSDRYCSLLADLECSVPSRVSTGNIRSQLETDAGVPVESALFELILAVELSMRNTMRRYAELRYAEIVPAGSPGAFDFVWETVLPSLSRRAARAGVTALAEILPESQRAIWRLPSKPYAEQLAKLRKRALRRSWSGNMATLALAADSRGLTYAAMGDAYLRVGHGAMQHIIFASSPVAKSGALRKNRDGSHEYLALLKSAGLPTVQDDSERRELQDSTLKQYRFVVLRRRSIAALERRPRHDVSSNDPDSYEYHDVTESIHGKHRLLAVRAAEFVGAQLVGIDFISRDITRPPDESASRISAVTTQPDLLRHVLPDSGTPRDVGGAVLNMLCQTDSAWTIPTAMIAGSRGTIAIGRDLDKILCMSGRIPGLCTRLSTTVGGAPVNSGSRGLLTAYRYLINDPRVEFLIKANSPRRIVENGLIADNCNVAAFVDPQPEDDELDYWRGVGVVVRATSGPLVVDAASECARKLYATVSPQRLILVSRQSDTPMLQRHLVSGGRVLSLRDSGGTACLELARGSDVLATFPVSKVLIGNGKSGNKKLVRRLFALAIAIGAGVPAPQLQSVLTRQAEMHR